MKNGISAIIIAKNEEERIQACLQGLSWADERILIDNNSSDNTVQIARKYDVRIFKSTSNSFSFLREMGLDKSLYSWIIYVDADEVVSGSLRKEVLDLISSFKPGYSDSAYYIFRKNYYLGHLWPFKDKMLRLFHRNELKSWSGQLHETAHVSGNVGSLKEPLIHYTHRSIDEMVLKTNNWSHTEAMLRYNAQHPKIVPWRLMRVMATAFIDSFIAKGGWKAGTIGWIESIYQAFSIFITYSKLWELQNSKNISEKI